MIDLAALSIDELCALLDARLLDTNEVSALAIARELHRRLLLPIVDEPQEQPAQKGLAPPDE